MAKVSFQNHEDRLNAIEVLKDYRAKIQPNDSRAHVFHDQDENGATLVLHVHGADVEEAASLATLAERLKAASDEVAKDLADQKRKPVKKASSSDDKQQPSPLAQG